MKNGPCGIISNRMKEVGEGSAGFRSELNRVNGVDEAGDSEDETDETDETGGDGEPNMLKRAMSDISVVVVVVDGGEGRDEVESGSRSGLLNSSDSLKGLNLTKGGVVGAAVGWRDVFVVGRGRFFLRMNGLFLAGVSDCSTSGLAFNMGLLDVVALPVTPGLLVFIVVITVGGALTFCSSKLLISSFSDSSTTGGLDP